MFCCSTKKKQKEQVVSIQRNNKILTEFSEEINDEAMTLYQSAYYPNISTLFQYPAEPNSMRQFIWQYRPRSGSNTKTTRSVERLTNALPQFVPRKTSFNSFRYSKTNQNTKFVSTKKGFTLLVTNTNPC
ncbi:unnamed protein product (macronuclear) [Paramecium tetraurelia]|uniref:Uncharacterized protein n=1 Tax=Paramecium tetraurelia TaxID=5888 RepID=A0BBD9_PARTE|nr:uncharacterized protein GSPATT00000291001 [Paramecium tetraurelia]CAK55856.1 unnamed protein product [Paramecium tetraurelia]|eukprot:XP_001423254.1 hypothetical protein (macronuclear) [Paramecium tetraurelia strain d4-2]